MSASIVLSPFRTRALVDSSLGQNIKRIRTLQDVSQGSLAEATGTTIPYIAQVEYGSICPERKVLALIAAELDCTIADLEV